MAVAHSVWSFLTWPCQSDVLIRMMLSGSWLSDTRMWFSWSYTVFLGICDRREEMKTCSSRWRSSNFCGFSFQRIKKQTGRWAIFRPAVFLLPTCRWQRVSRERSLSKLLALSFCGLLGWRSFNDVLRPRLPANLGSCLCVKEPEGGGKTGRRNGAKKKWEKKNNECTQPALALRKHRCSKIFQHLLDEMMRDSVLVILPLGGNLSRNVSMLSISSSVVGVTASGCS